MAAWHWWKEPKTQEQIQVLVPLTDVNIKGCTNGVLTKLDVQLTYVNQMKESPIEVTFEFPLTEKSSVTKLTA